MTITGTMLQSLRSKQRYLKKPKKTYDGQGTGLYIHVKPGTGARMTWRVKYLFEGGQKTFTIGDWPEVSIKEARAASAQVQADAGRGTDPNAVKRQEREGYSDLCEDVARKWWDAWAPTVKGGRESAQAIRNLKRLEIYVFSRVGRRPLGTINAACWRNEVLAPIAKAGKWDTLDKVRTLIGQLSRWAVVHEFIKADATTTLRDAFKRPKAAGGNHFAAILDPKRLGEFLLAVDGYDSGFPTTKLALQLVPLLLLRPINLRTAEWKNIDLDDATWTIPREKLKQSEVDLIVPLPTQAVEILRKANALTGKDEYVFPSTRGNGRPMSENTVLAAMRTLGFTKDEVTGHGFRATARTLLREHLKYPTEIIEHQLNHAVRSPNGRAYDRTEFLAERRKMMQAWVDYLDTLRTSAS